MGSIKGRSIMAATVPWLVLSMVLLCLIQEEDASPILMPNILQGIDHRDPYIVDYPKRNDPYSFGLGKRSTDDSHSLLPSLLWGIPLKHPVIRSVKRTDP